MVFCLLSTHHNNTPSNCPDDLEALGRRHSAVGTKGRLFRMQFGQVLVLICYPVDPFTRLLHIPHVWGKRGRAYRDSYEGIGHCSM